MLISAHKKSVNDVDDDDSSARELPQVTASSGGGGDAVVVAVVEAALVSAAVSPGSRVGGALLKSSLSAETSVVEEGLASTLAISFLFGGVAADGIEVSVVVGTGNNSRPSA